MPLARGKLAIAPGGCKWMIAKVNILRNTHITFYIQPINLKLYGV
jgi:hypothetical protein